MSFGWYMGYTVYVCVRVGQGFYSLALFPTSCGCILIICIFVAYLRGPVGQDSRPNEFLIIDSGLGA